MKNKVSIYELRLWRKEAEQTFAKCENVKQSKRLTFTAMGLWRVYLNGRCITQTDFDVEALNKYNEIKI